MLPSASGGASSYNWLYFFVIQIMEDHQACVFFNLFGPLARNFCHTGDGDGGGEIGTNIKEQTNGVGNGRVLKNWDCLD